MSDGLLDRIAAVALNAYEGNPNAWNQSEGDIKRRDWLEIADAVIRELGRYEYAVASDDLEVICVYVDDRSELDGVPLHEGERIVRRYVTNWEDTDG